MGGKQKVERDFGKREREAMQEALKPKVVSIDYVIQQRQIGASVWLNYFVYPAYEEKEAREKYTKLSRRKVFASTDAAHELRLIRKTKTWRETAFVEEKITPMLSANYTEVEELRVSRKKDA